MSENKDESNDESKDNSGIGISDDQLPEDLVPSEDNPLAEGLPDGETVDDVRAEEGRADSAEDKQPDAPNKQSADDDSSADSADQSNG